MPKSRTGTLKRRGEDTQIQSSARVYCLPLVCFMPFYTYICVSMWVCVCLSLLPPSFFIHFCLTGTLTFAIEELPFVRVFLLFFPPLPPFLSRRFTKPREGDGPDGDEQATGTRYAAEVVAHV